MQLATHVHGWWLWRTAAAMHALGLTPSYCGDSSGSMAADEYVDNVYCGATTSVFEVMESLPSAATTVGHACIIFSVLGRQHPEKLTC
jgi:hypothetical protein